MIGINRQSGKPLTPEAHLDQSIVDILTTPIGSRVMRRDYGSRLPELIDAPVNDETVLEAFVAAAEALRKWESRFKVIRIRLADANANGFGNIRIEGVERKSRKAFSRLVNLPGRMVS